jgi:small subunit ribosomal protein S17
MSVSAETRNDRKVRQGVVVSDVQDKTIVVRVQRTTTHPLYNKTIRVSKKYHVHDEANDAKVGDTVRIVETRPLSKLKRWRLEEVVERAK